VTAAGITADPATGGYWIVKSNGGVDAIATPGTGRWPGTSRQLPLESFFTNS
jgi:hypothetical protein